jgi:hypothetical protein
MLCRMLQSWNNGKVCAWVVAGLQTYRELSGSKLDASAHDGVRNAGLHDLPALTN